MKRVRMRNSRHKLRVEMNMKMSERLDNKMRVDRLINLWRKKIVRKSKLRVLSCECSQGRREKLLEWQKNTRRFACDLCPFFCFYRADWNRHGLIHLYENKPRHACPHCSHTFGLEDNLNLHLKTHTRLLDDSPEMPLLLPQTEVEEVTEPEPQSEPHHHNDDEDDRNKTPETKLRAGQFMTQPTEENEVTLVEDKKEEEVTPDKSIEISTNPPLEIPTPIPSSPPQIPEYQEAEEDAKDTDEMTQSQPQLTRITQRSQERSQSVVEIAREMPNVERVVPVQQEEVQILVEEDGSQSIEGMNMTLVRGGRKRSMSIEIFPIEDDDDDDYNSSKEKLVKSCPRISNLRSPSIEPDPKRSMWEKPPITLQIVPVSEEKRQQEQPQQSPSYYDSNEVSADLRENNQKHKNPLSIFFPGALLNGVSLLQQRLSYNSNNLINNDNGNNNPMQHKIQPKQLQQEQHLPERKSPERAKVRVIQNNNPIVIDNKNNTNHPQTRNNNESSGSSNHVRMSLWKHLHNRQQGMKQAPQENVHSNADLHHHNGDSHPHPVFSSVQIPIPKIQEDDEIIVEYQHKLHAQRKSKSSFNPNSNSNSNSNSSSSFNDHKISSSPRKNVQLPPGISIVPSPPSTLQELLRFNNKESESGDRIVLHYLPPSPAKSQVQITPIELSTTPTKIAHRKSIEKSLPMDGLTQTQISTSSSCTLPISIPVPIPLPMPMPPPLRISNSGGVVVERCARRSSKGIMCPSVVGISPLWTACPFCAFQSNKTGELTLHMTLHAGNQDVPYKCSRCEFFCIERETLNQHSLIFHAPHHQQELQQIQQRQPQIQEKIQRVIPEQQEGRPKVMPSNCTRIGVESKMGAGEEDQNQNQNQNQGPVPCPYEGCTYVARQKSLLKSHQVSHRRDKPFLCSVCQRGFGRKSHVTRHMLIHTKKAAGSLNSKSTSNSTSITKARPIQRGSLGSPIRRSSLGNSMDSPNFGAQWAMGEMEMEKLPGKNVHQSQFLMHHDEMSHQSQVDVDSSAIISRFQGDLISHDLDLDNQPVDYSMK